MLLFVNDAIYLKSWAYTIFQARQDLADFSYFLKHFNYFMCMYVNSSWLMSTYFKYSFCGSAQFRGIMWSSNYSKTSRSTLRSSVKESRNRLVFRSAWWSQTEKLTLNKTCSVSHKSLHHLQNPSTCGSYKNKWQVICGMITGKTCFPEWPVLPLFTGTVIRSPATISPHLSTCAPWYRLGTRCTGQRSSYANRCFYLCWFYWPHWNWWAVSSFSRLNTWVFIFPITILYFQPYWNNNNN